MRRKRTIYKALLTFIYLTIALVPYLNYKNKADIQNKYREIRNNVYLNIPETSTDLHSTLLSCDTIERFVADYPVELDIELNYKNYPTTDTTEIIIKRSDFIKKVSKIDNVYRQHKNRANWIMLAYIIIAQFILIEINSRINKYTNKSNKVT